MFEEIGSIKYAAHNDPSKSIQECENPNFQLQIMKDIAAGVCETAENESAEFLLLLENSGAGQRLVNNRDKVFAATKCATLQSRDVRVYEDKSKVPAEGLHPSDGDPPFYISFDSAN